MRCSVLQRVAVCCSVLECMAVGNLSSETAVEHVYLLHIPKCVVACCSAMYCVAVRCSVLQYVAVCCSLLMRVSWAARRLSRMLPFAFSQVYCSVLQCNVLCCSVLQCVVVCCSVWSVLQFMSCWECLFFAYSAWALSRIQWQQSSLFKKLSYFFIKIIGHMG